MNPIRIGTRSSTLALWQAHWVEEKLQRHGFASQIVKIGTSGDRDRQQPISELGIEGVFTKEIQRALLDGAIDLAVHSLKDLPTETVEGLEFVASPKRGPYRDAFVSNKADTLDLLPDGSRIGTGSVRRKAQLLNLFGTRFQIVDIRGNVETRLKKLDAGDSDAGCSNAAPSDAGHGKAASYDAIVLAEAGLVRLGLHERITAFLEPPQFLPAIGQGALGIEIRSDDTGKLSAAMDCLNDLPTYAAVTAERSLLRSLRGGCLAPIAAFCEVKQSAKASLTLTARVLSPDGQQRLEAAQSQPILFSQNNNTIRDIATELGRDVADKLLAAGADRLLR
ncbi:MAG: hydroxymethylbilane synthase [Planctomycetaceae bacterium]|nr:hydroxymethylbilane synthase [Planctomycetaceae bacterium]